MPTTDDWIEMTRREVKKFRDEKDQTIDELLTALEELVAATEAEVNEKGGGGSVLARLSDAKDAIKNATAPL